MLEFLIITKNQKSFYDSDVMSKATEQKLFSFSKESKPERKIQAKAVSRGIAIGKVVCLYGRRRQFYQVAIDESQIEKEIRRFRASIRLAKRQLKKIGLENSDKNNTNKIDIFDTHILILEDASLGKKIEDYIGEKKCNAEWAVKIVLDDYISKYKLISDEHLREKYIDLEDITDRILNALGGGKQAGVQLDENSIIVAKEVKPSTLIELDKNKPLAIITERGGWTSHTFILARELNLPSITGVKDVLRVVQTGDEVIVNGYNGEIIVNPSENTRREFQTSADKHQYSEFKNYSVSGGAAETLDKTKILVRANLDFYNVYKNAEKLGACGIGLYRSEFLFNQFKGFPSEEEQFEAYREIGKIVGEKGVRIRTFDLSLEQIAEENSEREKNPALGLRGIRLGVLHKKQFRTQIRALLRAAADFEIDIILPMISDIAEIWNAKRIIKKEKQKLKNKKIKFGNPKIGAMIEVPATVLIIEDIVEEIDFLCLGTNDLVQYLLAVDRDNPTVAEWFQTLHPAVIKSLKIVISHANKKSIPAIICGEMAGSPFYVPILLGLGATELSMNINSIPRVRKTISGIAIEETKELIKQIENCKTPAQIEETLKKCFSEKWSHLEH